MVYFFSALDKKYETGTRINRKTKGAYWSATVKDREIRGGDELVGLVKTLVFHNGRFQDSQRTNWVIHEYHHLVENESQKNESSQRKQICTVLGTRVGDDVVMGEDHAPIVVDDNGTNEIEQETKQTQRKYLFDLNELSREYEIDDDDELHKRVNVADDVPLCVHNKRKRKTSSSIGNSSGSTSQTTKDYDDYSATATTMKEQ